MKKEKNTKNRKKTLAVLSAVSLCAIMLSTFAWNVYEASKENKFGNALLGGSVEVEEIFPDPLIEEGGSVQKEVWTVNTSSANVLVRLSFEEFMKTLITDGATTNAKIDLVTDANIDPATKLPTANPTAIPVAMDSAYYAGLAKANTANDPLVDWADVTSKMAPAVPAGVTVLAKQKNQDVTPPGETVTKWKAEVEYVIYRKFAIANSNMGEVSKEKVVKYYDMTTGANDALFIAQEGSAADATGKSKITSTFDQLTGIISAFNYTPADLEFKFYEGFAPQTTANWAGADKHATGIDPAVPQTVALVGESIADSNLILTYSTHLKTDASVGSWMYNEEDGYFYYIGIVGSGSKTNTILDKVGLKNKIGSKYAYLDYSLWVDAEGILPNIEAVKEQFFPTTPTVGSTSEKIYQALDALIITGTVTPPTP